jgi:hypothetical protein
MRYPVRIDKEVWRGDYSERTFLVPGNHTARKLIFVVKASKAVTASRLIEKKNDIAGGSTSEIEVSAQGTMTKIIVKILKANTDALTSAIYYYDITTEHASNDSDHYTICWGNFDLSHDIQTPYDGALVYNVDTSLIRYVYSGQTVKNIIAAFSDEAADRVYTVVVYPGATMGSSFVNRSYINYLWLTAGPSWDFNEANITSMNLSNQDFTNADFTNCNCTSVVWTGAIVDSADFTGATISLSKNDFKDTVGHFDPDTTIWTDGNAIGDI